MSEHPDWPPALRVAMASPALERRGWQKSLAPNLIGLFLWIGFFDQIPSETVGRSGLAWPVLGLAIGGVLSYLLLFRTPLLWTHRTGRPLAVVATSTFGVRGSAWVPGLLNACLQVVWIAIALRYATLLTLRGLELVDLLGPSYKEDLVIGRYTFPGGLFLATSFFWGLAGTLAGRYLVRVIGALMTVYPVVVAILVGITAALAMPRLPEYRVMMAGALSRGGSEFSVGLSVALQVIQMVFAFSAAAALSCADFGLVTTSEADVKRGGWVGVAGSILVVGMLSILTVAGAFVRYGIEVPVSPSAARSLTFIHAVESLIGGRTAGGMIMAFGLAGLAPACFSSYLFSTRLNDAIPRVARTKWTVLGFLVSWVMVITGQVDRLYNVFSIVGALLAPVAGAMTADAIKHGGKWPGARFGLNRAGIVSWSGGAVVGLLPFIIPNSSFAKSLPASLIAFVLSFVAYLLASAILGEPKIDTEIDPIAQESTIPSES